MKRFFNGCKTGRELHEEMAMLDREKIAEFILRALARPMLSREEA
jgi:hypothetical protein